MKSKIIIKCCNLLRLCQILYCCKISDDFFVLCTKIRQCKDKMFLFCRRHLEKLIASHKSEEIDWRFLQLICLTSLIVLWVLSYVMCVLPDDKLFWKKPQRYKLKHHSHQMEKLSNNLIVKERKMQILSTIRSCADACKNLEKSNRSSRFRVL